MGEVVEVKIRSVGNALGVILPKRVIEAEGLRKGETVSLSLFKKRKVNLDALFGLTKGKGGLVRERDHRD